MNKVYQLSLMQQVVEMYRDGKISLRDFRNATMKMKLLIVANGSDQVLMDRVNDMQTIANNV